jgi:chitinase
MFGYHQGVVAGIYLGPSFGKATVSSVMDRLLEQVHSGSATTVTAQLCGEGRNAHHVSGMVVNTAGNITAVQNVVKDWNEAK